MVCDKLERRRYLAQVDLTPSFVNSRTAVDSTGREIELHGCLVDELDACFQSRHLVVGNSDARVIRCKWSAGGNDDSMKEGLGSMPKGTFL
jgi:hypothetical protein